MYYKNAIGACVVFDVTSRDSFEKCQQWVKELNEKASADIRIVIVGNKIDLEDHQVSRDEAQDYARGQGLQYSEVSAKQNTGIDELFKDLAKKLPKESTNKKQNSLKTKKLEAAQSDQQAGWCC